MNKTELLALCERLGIVTTGDMTIDELKALIAGFEIPVADATKNNDQSLAKGHSAVSSFRYIDGKDGRTWCHVTMVNGVNGIIGLLKIYKFRDMIALKGSGTEVGYRATGEMWTDKAGQTHPKYRLEWSLE